MITPSGVPAPVACTSPPGWMIRSYVWLVAATVFGIGIPVVIHGMPLTAAPVSYRRVEVASIGRSTYRSGVVPTPAPALRHSRRVPRPGRVGASRTDPDAPTPRLLVGL